MSSENNKDLKAFKKGYKQLKNLANELYNSIDDVNTDIEFTAKKYNKKNYSIKLIIGNKHYIKLSVKTGEKFRNSFAFFSLKYVKKGNTITEFYASTISELVTYLFIYNIINVKPNNNKQN